MFRKDVFLFGLLLGSILPTLLFFGLKLFFVDFLEIFIEINTIYVLSILVNFLIFRYYMINIQMDKTGRGILLGTFGHAFVYVYLYIM
jgi:hypothetical protein